MEQLVTRSAWSCYKCFPGGFSGGIAKSDDDHLCIHHALLEILKCLKRLEKSP